MKKTLIALMALAGVAVAAPITLDSKYTSQDGSELSFYSNADTTGGFTLENVTAAPSLTFYIEVSDLFGVEGLTANKT